MALTLSDRKQVRPLNGAILRQFEVAVEVKLGYAVAIDANGKVKPAKAAYGEAYYGRGIVVSGEAQLGGKDTFAAGEMVGVVLSGPIAGFSGMDESLAVYVSSTTAGSLTQTNPSAAGTYTSIIGRADKDNILWVIPTTDEPTYHT